MSDEPANDPDDKVPRRKREPATIDLSATEIPAGQAASPDAASPSPRSGDNARSRPWTLAAAALFGAAVVVVAAGAAMWSGYWPRGDAGVAELAVRVANIEARPVARYEPAIDPKVLTDIAARLARIEAAQATPVAPVQDPALPGLTNRLAGLEASMRSLGDAVAMLNRRNEDIVAALRDVRQRADAAAAALEELQSADRNRAPASDKEAIEQLSARIAALENSTRNVEEKLVAPANGDRTVRTAMLAAALKEAVERGAPFAAQLAAVKPLVDASAAAMLEPFAAAGIPSAQALGAELVALVPAMSEALEGPARDDSLIGRMQAHANRLVRIRPLDAPASAEPRDMIARARARAARGDIAGALAEIGRLPAAAREPAAAWVAKAQARAAALAAAQSIAAAALSAVGKAS